MIIKKVACLYQGITYQMNSSWPDTRDVCKEFTCHQDSDGEVEIQIKRENCNTDCPKGSKYMPGDEGSCCGYCQEGQCTMSNGSILDIGQTVEASCATLYCKADKNQAILVEEAQSCPYFNSSCPPGNVAQSPDGCCSVCKQCTDLNGYVYDKGTTWTKDLCTECTCTESVLIECRVQECKDPVCSPEYKLITRQGTEEQCCPDKECEPLAVTCPEVSLPTCAYDQDLKNITGENGCTSYACECTSSCPQPVQVGHLDPGESWTLDTGTGCCPVYIKSCNPESCTPESCPQFYESRQINSTSCCSQYICERPKDLCIYSPPNSSNTTLKKIGESWDESVCKECTCAGNSVNPGNPYNPSDPGSPDILPEVQCTTQQCLKEPRSKDYVYEEVTDPDKCCSQWNKVACKVDGSHKQIGDHWYGSTSCDKFECQQGSDGQIQIKLTQQKCDTICDEGYEYMSDEGSCCGSCLQTHCVDATGQLILPNQTIQPEPCRKQKCVPGENGKFILVEEIETCPALDTNCPKDKIQVSENGCCRNCNLTESDCKLKSKKETVGVITFFDDVHGNCRNLQSLPGIMECKGTCQSGNSFDQKLGYHVSECTCCQAKEQTSITISITCDDGAQVNREISVPSSCSCELCSETLSGLTNQVITNINSNTAVAGESDPGAGGYGANLVASGDPDSGANLQAPGYGANLGQANLAGYP